VVLLSRLRSDPVFAGLPCLRLFATVLTLAATTVVASPTATATAMSTAGRTRCARSGTTVQAPTGPSAALQVVQTADGSKPEIAMSVYPRPNGPPGGSNPWSQWGQGLVLSDGRFVSAMGDHRGVDGDSYLFIFDPATETLTRFTDVLTQVRHQRGETGYGKIHAQIVAGPCGEVYVATYWGDRDEVHYGGDYRGDLLFRLDPSDLTLHPLGAPVPEHGIPSLASLGRGIVYGEAALPEQPEPERDHEQGAFFAYDVRKERVVFRSDDLEHALFRNVMIDAKDRAYVAGEDGHLLVYEPGASDLRRLDQPLPGGGFLRASTRPAPNGTVYGVTQYPDRFFALNPDGNIRDLGAANGYTASLALAPDGSRFYYVPGAHGDAFELGTPVMAVDTRTGAQTVVARLNPLAEDHLGLILGGSYDLAVADHGRTLYIGLNAGKTRDDPWGEVVLAVVTLSS
jgi:hypothetical protein